MFEEKGYQVVKNFLNEDFLEFIQQYFYIKLKSGQTQFGDLQAPNSYVFKNDTLMDTILACATKSLSEIVGKTLLPTYTYTRLYGKGDELYLHQDRESCEYSATLSISFPKDSKVNPIYFSTQEDKSDAVEILLNPGDLCLYRGCDLWHWRPPFEQNWYLQAFLHYVDANGPHKDHMYDKKEYLGIPDQ
jgi:hypothetical protein